MIRPAISEIFQLITTTYMYNLHMCKFSQHTGVNSVDRTSGLLCVIVCTYVHIYHVIRLNNTYI